MPLPSDRELLRRIERSTGQRAGYKQLVRELGLGGGRERRLLLEQLARMTARGQLVKPDREQWGLPSSLRPAPGSAGDRLLAGRVDLHRDGYGFVRPEASGGERREDVFLPPDSLGGAMQGDQVLVELSLPEAGRGRERRSGRVVRVITRANPTVVGVFHYGSGRSRERADALRGNSVVPFDERMAAGIAIAPGDEIPPRLSGPRSGPQPGSGSGSQVGSPSGPGVHRVLGREARAAARGEGEDLEGLVVDVEILDWPTASRPARGRVLEILGHPDDFGVDVEMMIRKHHLPRVFPADVLEEAADVALPDEEEAESRARQGGDFRPLPIVTIDGESARDFDDAVLVTERKEGGYELQVHIADVAHYVLPGSALDLEARLRGTSVYFPDRAIPMLPQELSSGICSLRPGEDRLVLSCLMEIDAQGRIEAYQVIPGVIRSAARMTYTEVHGILEGDAALRERFSSLAGNFDRMKELALKLNRQRALRGSIDFDLPEPIIEFDEFGAMKSVTRSDRNWAHRLIEEFMLAANECVATWLEDLGVPSLYRVHEKPDPRRILDFEQIAAAFGYSLGVGSLPVRRFSFRDPRGGGRAGTRAGGRREQHELPEEVAVTPKMYQKLTARIAGKPEERILSYLMLRSLKQARYSEQNLGHFALAAPTYTHFTSPIRRYPDLIVHRIAKALLAEGVRSRGTISEERLASPWRAVGEQAAPAPRPPAVFRGTPPMAEPELAQIAAETSQTERRAADAERELVEWKKIKFMQDRVGEDFAAMVMNATRHGLFVELEEMFIEGLVPIDLLPGDHYTYHETSRQLIGDRSGRKFSVGDRVRVVLNRVLAIERRLQFSLLEENSAPHRPARVSKTGKRKGKQAGAERAAGNAARRSGSGSGSGAASGRPYRPPKNAVRRKGKKRKPR